MGACTYRAVDLVPERDNYTSERNQAIAAFFYSLASLAGKAETAIDIVIEQEKETDQTLTRRRPGRTIQ